MTRLSAATGGIPNIIHRIWLGDSLPDSAIEPWRRWAQLFPDYQLITWRESELANLGMPDHFASARTYAERSDIARIEILNRVGGLYVDCDVRPLRRFDHLWTEKDKIVVFEMVPGELINGCLAAAPGALRFVRRFIERNARRSAPEAAPVVRTGPQALAAAIDYQLSIDGRGLRRLSPAFVAFGATDRDTYPALGQDHDDAVIATELRRRPSWTVAPDVATHKTSRLSGALFELSMVPLRARRRL